MTYKLKPGTTLAEAGDLVTPMAIRVAVALRIAHHIVAGQRTTVELAAETETNADTLERVLIHLVAAEVLTRDGIGRYGLTSLGEEMLVEAQMGPPPRMGLPPWLDLNSPVGRAEMSFTRLLDVVKTGEVAYLAHFGSTFWQDLAEYPSSAASFNTLMGDQVAFRAREVADAYDWSALGEVVDVGGGDGTFLVALLRAHPTLRGTVVDRSAEPAQRTILNAGLADRARAIAGNFLEALPPGAGGYVLSRVQSDWNDADVRTILRRCAEAAGPGGKVMLVDEFAAEEGARCDPETDLRMLVYFGGKERTMEQVRDLAADVGMSVESLVPVRDWTIMELTSIVQKP